MTSALLIAWGIGIGIVWADAIYNSEGYNAPGAYLRSFIAGPLWPLVIPWALFRSRRRQANAVTKADINRRSLDEILQHIDDRAAEPYVPNPDDLKDDWMT